MEQNKKREKKVNALKTDMKLRFKKKTDNWRFKKYINFLINLLFM